MKYLALLLGIVLVAGCLAQNTQPKGSYYNQQGGGVVSNANNTGLTMTNSNNKTNSYNNGTNRHAIIETDKGNIEIELAEDRAPITTGNFIKLAQEGFYDGLKFHRVIRGFMIQTGDPYSRDDDPRVGTGGPGYTIDDEYDNGLLHDKCVISMANTGVPHSSGSQFFITEQPAHWLDGGYSIFGHVTKGCEIVPVIEQGDVMNKVRIE